jgi:hypothetical protein
MDNQPGFITMDGSRSITQPARLAGLVVAVSLLLSATGGCSTIVRPPAQTVQPVTIYLTDQFIHSSVIMPVEDGRFVEYAFGDWTYAALNHHDPFHTVRALFFSPQGALGRRYLTVDPKSKDLAPELKGITVNTLVVDREQVRTLVAKLDGKFTPDRSQAENPDNHFWWVTVDDSYALWSNCNTLTKSNLRDLGCGVQSRSPFAMYNVEQPAAVVTAGPSHGEPATSATIVAGAD